MSLSSTTLTCRLRRVGLIVRPCLSSPHGPVTELSNMPKWPKTGLSRTADGQLAWQMTEFLSEHSILRPGEARGCQCHAPCAPEYQPTFFPLPINTVRTCDRVPHQTTRSHFISCPMRIIPVSAGGCRHQNLVYKHHHLSGGLVPVKHLLPSSRPCVRCFSCPPLSALLLPRRLKTISSRSAGRTTQVPIRPWRRRYHSRVTNSSTKSAFFSFFTTKTLISFRS